MFSIPAPARLAALFAVLLLGSSIALTPVRAQSGPGPHGPVIQFNGQVIAVAGPPDSPTGFTLLHGALTTDFRLAPAASLQARSAEAAVAGFATGDYALVTARRVKFAWVAIRVSYDVNPIPGRAVIVVLTGTIVRVSPNGKILTIKLVNGTTHDVFIDLQTTFRVDGQLTDTPPLLSAGEVVTVRTRHAPRGWVAIDVNLRTTSSALVR